MKAQTEEEKEREHIVQDSVKREKMEVDTYSTN